MSDTPRTDAELRQMKYGHVSAEFARQLEREIARLQRKLDALPADWSEANSETWLPFSGELKGAWATRPLRRIAPPADLFKFHNVIQ